MGDKEENESTIDWADDSDPEDAEEHVPEITAPQVSTEVPSEISHSNQTGPTNIYPPQRKFNPRPPREKTPIPTQPPWKVYIGNLSFQAVDSDVRDFFTHINCKVVSVKLPHPDSAKQGFAYVEFEDLESLKNALEQHDKIFMDRPLKVDVALDSDRRPAGRGRGGPRDDKYRRFGNRDGEERRTPNSDNAWTRRSGNEPRNDEKRDTKSENEPSSSQALVEGSPAGAKKQKTASQDIFGQARPRDELAAQQKIEEEKKKLVEGEKKTTEDKPIVAKNIPKQADSGEKKWPSRGENKGRIGRDKGEEKRAGRDRYKKNEPITRTNNKTDSKVGKTRTGPNTTTAAKERKPKPKKENAMPTTAATTVISNPFGVLGEEDA